MTEFDRAYKAAKKLLEGGEFPTPTLMNAALGHEKRAKQNMLNGVETQARIVALEEAGFTKHPVTGRWRP